MKGQGRNEVIFFSIHSILLGGIFLQNWIVDWQTVWRIILRQILRLNILMSLTLSLDEIIHHETPSNSVRSRNAHNTSWTKMKSIMYSFFSPEIRKFDCVFAKCRIVDFFSITWLDRVYEWWCVNHQTPHMLPKYCFMKVDRHWEKVFSNHEKVRFSAVFGGCHILSFWFSNF